MLTPSDLLPPHRIHRCTPNPHQHHHNWFVASKPESGYLPSSIEFNSIALTAQPAEIFTVPSPQHPSPLRSSPALREIISQVLPRGVSQSRKQSNQILGLVDKKTFIHYGTDRVVAIPLVFFQHVACHFDSLCGTLGSPPHFLADSNAHEPWRRRKRNETAPGEPWTSNWWSGNWIGQCHQRPQYPSIIGEFSRPVLAYLHNSKHFLAFARSDLGIRVRVGGGMDGQRASVGSGH